MSLYAQFGTDKNLESTGILLQYGQNSQGKDICIRIARAGGSNKQYQKRMEALVKPYRRQIQNETISNDVMEKLVQQAFAETVVLGWENVEDKDGKPMEFTVDNCLNLFKDLPDLFKDIQDQAQRSALFKAEVLETEAKN